MILRRSSVTTVPSVVPLEVGPNDAKEQRVAQLAAEHVDNPAAFGITAVVELLVGVLVAAVHDGPVVRLGGDSAGR